MLPTNGIHTHEYTPLLIFAAELSHLSACREKKKRFKPTAASISSGKTLPNMRCSFPSTTTLFFPLL